MRDYVSRIRIDSNLMEFLETSDCTDEYRKDETCLQFKMNKHFIKTRKISETCIATCKYTTTYYDAYGKM